MKRLIFRWYHLDRDTEKPHHEEYYLVWEKQLSWTIAQYYEPLDIFIGLFHGYDPRWWMKLSVPEETEK